MESIIELLKQFGALKSELERRILSDAIKLKLIGKSLDQIRSEIMQHYHERLIKNDRKAALEVKMLLKYLREINPAWIRKPSYRKKG